MVELQINTTQNVNINFTAASVGERILSYIIDLIIKVAYFVGFGYVIFDLLDFNSIYDDLDGWSKNAVIAIFSIPVLFYTLTLESIFDGQTVGKKVMKVKVVKIDGYQASFPDFLMRWSLRSIDMLFIGFVALISIVTSKKSQRLGDMAAGTSVISLKNNVNISHTILEDLEDTYTPTYPSVIKLSDNDARIIKDTFITAKAAKDYTTLIKLRKKIIEVIDIKEVNGNDIEFIDTILKDYNYYTQSM
ncbi:RDD family protein [Gaetbulibacter jejuensis]|uniref:RDD family protein n=1 Tax=Gaetbulibacter jejuensis TaxID=584607 RepID=A0ABN1JMI1_9FLAO